MAAGLSYHFLENAVEADRYDAIGGATKFGDYWTKKSIDIGSIDLVAQETVITK